MNVQDFDKLVEDWLTKIRVTLMVKGGEYAGEQDRLENFKLSAFLEQGTPEQALLGFVTKHIVSVYDTVGREITRDENYWKEKLGDIINYMILLSALLKERENDSILSQPPNSRE